MAIYLLRNSSPEIEKGVCYGQTDINVSANFEEDFSIILPKLANLTIDKIYSSTLKRSAILAERIAENLRLKMVQDSRLKEFNYGLWEMQKWEKIPPTELNIWMSDFVNLKAPHGESYVDLYKRVNEFLNTNDLRNSLIISHAGTIRSILCSLTNTPLNDSFKKFDIKHNEIYEVDIVKRSYHIHEVKWQYKA